MLVASCIWESGGWLLWVSISSVVRLENVCGTAGLVLHGSRHYEHYSAVKSVIWTALIRMCDL